MCTNKRVARFVLVAPNLLDVATQAERDLIESLSSPELDIVIPVDVAASASAPLEDEAMAARAARQQQQKQKPPLRQQQPVPALDMSSESSASEDDEDEARQALNFLHGNYSILHELALHLK